MEAYFTLAAALRHNCVMSRSEANDVLPTAPSLGLTRFAGRTAIVTGAGSGIGEATALAFAREGARVVVADRALERAQRVADAVVAAGGEARAAGCDVTVSAQADAVVEMALAWCGRLDVLVNNAGLGHSGSVLATDEAAWDRVMDVNAKGTFLMSRAALPALRAQRGVIVNTASVAGVRGLPDRAVYCASKFAVVGLTRAMALDHVKDGVRVNCVCPGTIETPWIAERLAEAPDAVAARASLVARQPMGRLGRPEEVAAAILFLASDESSFTTGTALVSDGGFSA